MSQAVVVVGVRVVMSGEFRDGIGLGLGEQFTGAVALHDGSGQNLWTRKPRRRHGMESTLSFFATALTPGGTRRASVNEFRLGQATESEEERMPELMTEGLPERGSRSKFDFAEWADGQAWKFVKGTDYDSSTETFRANVKRWAKVNGYDVELRPFPSVDRAGREVPLVKADAIALGVRFVANGATVASVSSGSRRERETATNAA
jgi:hypothetical protein